MSWHADIVIFKGAWCTTHWRIIFLSLIITGSLMFLLSLSLSACTLLLRCSQRCLLEIHTAVSAQVAVIMKGGSHRKQPNGSVTFESNHDMLNILTQFVDINHTEASVPSDRDKILSMIEESEGGTASKSFVGLLSYVYCILLYMTIYAMSLANACSRET